MQVHFWSKLQRGGTLVGNTNLEVTWDVAGTDGNGVDCSSVDIYLSTDGGYTFPTLLVAGTPNDGSERVVAQRVHRPSPNQGQGEQPRVL